MIARLPALVLTAGLGTRLFPLTVTRAKPAAPVAGVSLVIRILRGLAAQGVTDAVLNLHHRPETITRVVGDGEEVGVRVRYSWEHPRVLGSAGGPRRALPLLATSRFLIVNGDTLANVSLSGLADAHADSGAQVTLAVVPNREPQRYGGVLVADDGAVTGFTRRGETQPSWHFVGLQVAEAAVFAPLPDGESAESIGGVYRTLMAERPGSVHAWKTEGQFVDIGTPADYLRTHEQFAAAEGLARPFVGERCAIASTATLADTILWDDVVIEDHVTLERCVVADGARVPRGARYEEKALAPAAAWNAPLPAGARLEGDLIVAPLDPYASG